MLHIPKKFQIKRILYGIAENGVEPFDIILEAWATDSPEAQV